LIGLESGDQRDRVVLLKFANARGVMLPQLGRNLLYFVWPAGEVK